MSRPTDANVINGVIARLCDKLSDEEIATLRALVRERAELEARLGVVREQRTYYYEQMKLARGELAAIRTGTP